MRKQFFTLLITLSCLQVMSAQFHTLKVPRRSNPVTESQRVGITDITITYGSPAVNGRDVWTDENVIPKNEEPIAWRAGADMNTTIEFSTDVKINDQPLAAGKYGFHIIPNADETFTLLFAHNNQLWGSYYLDVENDITLKATTKAVSCPFSERLDYEFSNWESDSVTIGLEWADKQIPFTVSVDLNRTVVESLRTELRGLNTYRWEAWNDAANWCLYHDTNIEEALTWVDRSIDGGYYGFGANRNFTNVSTKARLLKKLNKKEEFEQIMDELMAMDYSAGEAYNFTRELIVSKEYEQTSLFLDSAVEKLDNPWYLIVNQSLVNYFMGNPKKAIAYLEKAMEGAPSEQIERFKTVISEMEAGTYEIPF